MRVSDQPEYRDDIVCPKSGELIPIGPLSVSKLSETSYYVYCPMCWGWHEFAPEPANPTPPIASGEGGE